ncbi:hypothetical protein L917_16460 [Phytophthora nicotianae]|uniref:Uncharacterized protein n=2 Tax=Phytophthora nicotianae TaxID=4792 RepID=W2KEF6_PHYNI|nr:hypothetical protein L915_16731 [Phytophthora nicotianae]ETL30368.1 hypothetical protein L916_16640 [Phytophthora nicotianae]ETL83601.1 hypothetical protein L917_16460 [Phytophthora nicotianae]
MGLSRYCAAMRASVLRCSMLSFKRLRLLGSVEISSLAGMQPGVLRGFMCSCKADGQLMRRFNMKYWHVISALWRRACNSI